VIAAPGAAISATGAATGALADAQRARMPCRAR
jgi:hypothetical protein